MQHPQTDHRCMVWVVYVLPSSHAVRSGGQRQHQPAQPGRRARCRDRDGRLPAQLPAAGPRHGELLWDRCCVNKVEFLSEAVTKKARGGRLTAQNPAPESQRSKPMPNCCMLETLCRRNCDGFLLAELSASFRRPRELLRPRYCRVWWQRVHSSLCTFR